MNYCPNCGAPVIVGQNFCRNCGLDIRARTLQEQAPTGSETPVVKALGRNTIVYLTQQGLVGTKIRSDLTLLLAFALPLPILFAYYAASLTGTLVVYATIWLAASTFLYDELRGRGLRSLENFDPTSPEPNRPSWLIPWRLVRMADWNGRTLWFSSSDPMRRASITFDKDDAPIVEQTLTSRGVRYSWRPSRLPKMISGFWTLSILLFIVSQLVMILAATLPFFPGEEQIYSAILGGTSSQISGTSFIGELHVIYLNNLQVALGGAFPFLGTLNFGVASYNTGRVIQVIAISDHVSPVAVLLTLYILPHTWVEELSYPMAAAAGLLVVTAWDSVSPSEFTKRWKRASGKYLLALGAATLTLLVAGLLETSTSYLGFLAVVLWVPLLIAVYLLRKRFMRDGRTTSAPQDIPKVAQGGFQTTGPSGI